MPRTIPLHSKGNFRKLKKKQLLVDIRKVSIRKNGQMINTYTYVMSFDTSNLLLKLKIGYMTVKVAKHIVNSL